MDFIFGEGTICQAAETSKLKYRQRLYRCGKRSEPHTENIGFAWCNHRANPHNVDRLMSMGNVRYLENVVLAVALGTILQWFASLGKKNSHRNVPLPHRKSFWKKNRARGEELSRATPMHELRAMADSERGSKGQACDLYNGAIHNSGNTEQWGKWHETLQLEGHRIRFNLDTGAQAKVHLQQTEAG